MIKILLRYFYDKNYLIDCNSKGRGIFRTKKNLSIKHGRTGVGNIYHIQTHRFDSSLIHVSPKQPETSHWVNLSRVLNIISGAGTKGLLKTNIFVYL